jgi:hypothetical protein
MRVYVDMVSSEPPQHRGKDRTAPPWRPHGVRIAAAVERDADNTISDVLLAYIPAGPSWRFDTTWVGKYLGSPNDLDRRTPGSIVDESPWLFGPYSVFIGHVASFHRDVLTGLVEDAGGPPGEREWFDTARGAEPICNIPAKNRGGTKVPSLIEAFQFFNGPMGDEAEILPARAMALRQLNRIRTVYWGIRRWGLPDAIPMPDGP